MPITLLNDVLFKVVFGSQRHSEALRGLLNAILDLTGDRRIAEITILNPLREKERLEDKATILDVKARDGQGALYNIEVQLQSQVGYKERSLFYAANMVCQQIQVGEEYRDLRKTIHISLTDFVLFPDQDDLHSTYLLYDKKHDRTLGDLFELHYLEMCKFRKLDVTELLSSLERWLFFFRQATNYTGVDNLPESLQLEEGMSTAMEATHQALSDEEVRYAIEARQKWERDRITQLNAAVEEGEARARGLALAKAELARSLLASGQSEEFVFEHTGLRRTDL
ncbi:unnamed protein product [Phaeothamnion confervicola]